MVSGNGLQAVKHYHRVSAMLEAERQHRRELQLLEYQRSATLSFLSTKDRTLAAKMLAVEAHRYQRALIGKCLTKNRDASSQRHSAEVHQMSSFGYVRDVVDDISVLMARVPPCPKRKSPTGTDDTKVSHPRSSNFSPVRPTRDQYLFVKSELAGIYMWRHHPSGSKPTL